MTPEVETAVEEIKGQFADVQAALDGNGGAYVTINDIELGAKFNPAKTWIKFHIVHTYPNADVYPHFIRPEIRIEGATFPGDKPLGEASSVCNVEHGNDHFTAIQLSRKSNNLDPNVDTALLKLLKVIEWLKARA